MSNNEMNLVRDILSSDSSLKASLMVYNNKDLLRGWNFILTGGDKKNIPTYVTEKTFSNGAIISSIFSNSKLVFLNNDIVDKMMIGKADIKIDYSIALDTQMVSYLKPFLNKQESRIPKGYDEIFDFIVRNDVNIDDIPFIYENIPNISNFQNIDKIRERLEAYEILKTIDKEKYKSNKVICSKLTQEEINKSVLDTINNMIKMKDNKKLIDYVNEPYKGKYCLLLKMILIQLKNPKRKRESKLMDFFEFCHYKLGVMSLRELKIASEYYINGKQLGFFDKIQTNTYDLLYNIKNMAWYLYHIFDIERRVRDWTYKKDNFFIPSFLTIDKRFIEIIKSYSIKGIAFSEDKGLIVPLCNFTELISSLDDSYKFEKFFSKKFIEERRQINGISNIDLIIEELEKEAYNYIKK